LYFDIEAEPDRNLDYLLGILLVDNVNNTQEFFPFLAETIAEEEKVWRDFFTFMMDYPNVPVFHFSGYEVDTIKRLAALYQTPIIQTKALLSRCVDIHHWVTKSVILPVESYSLKSLANWLGFQWRDETASGDQSVCWYDKWLTTQDRSLLNAILSYNEDDCYATYYVKDWLVKFFLEAQKRQFL
jgi:predicted RecB family nuclease